MWNAPCRRPSRHCSRRASTASAPASARCSSEVRSWARSSPPRTSSSLLDPDAAPTASAHLRDARGRGFVRPRDGEVFSFRHALVQEAVYRAAPKRLRADLHERFADRLDTGTHEIAEIDEFVGYHLEQAYNLRTELGESDRRTARLAEDGGRRLGEAGVRALKRGDMHATTNLLRRATLLLPADEPIRREFLCELGIAFRTSGDPIAAENVLAKAVRDSQKATDKRIELRARIEREYVRLLHEQGTTADALLEATAEGIPLFETVGDDRSLGRAWLLAGFVQGGHLGQHKAWGEAAERAMVHYRRSSWPISTCAGEFAAALYYGPTPVPDAIARCEQLLRDESLDRAGGANVLTFLGGLVAQHGEFDKARERLGSARSIYEDQGQRTVAATYCAAVLGDVELWASDAVAAEVVLRELCAELARTHDVSHLASRASDLAEALFAQDRLDESEEWADLAAAHASSDDRDAQTFWRSVRAKIHARRGEFETARKLGGRSGTRLRSRAMASTAAQEFSGTWARFSGLPGARARRPPHSNARSISTSRRATSSERRRFARSRTISRSSETRKAALGAGLATHSRVVAASRRPGRRCSRSDERSREREQTDELKSSDRTRSLMSHPLPDSLGDDSENTHTYTSSKRKARAVAGLARVAVA